MKTSPQTQILVPHIRWLMRRDLDEVLEIDSHGYPDAWDEERFLRQVRQRNCIALVAEVGNRIAGYAVYDLHKTHFLVNRLAVHPDYQRCRIGEQIIDRLAKKLTPHRRQHIAMGVRESNLHGQLFLRHCGFRAVRVLRGHYKDTQEDCYAMMLGIERWSSFEATAI